MAHHFEHRSLTTTSNQRKKMNKAEKTLEWVNARLSEGRTVYFQTALRTIKVDNKAVNRWAKSGNELFKLSDDGLRVGKDLVATPHQALVKVTAQ